ncbi:hypothetical protein, partial [Aquipuribacter hungaricus]|uniref:hypothetical protein n=1 Tax=Aquipuribacter hungaricus TaxID=545624 RepID=UPI0030EF3C35
MARPLSYTPPVPPDTGAADELDDLVAALHESGLLRAAAGGVRAYPELLGLLMGSLDPAALRSVLALGGAAGGLDPQAAERLATGVRQARVSAVAAATGRPPGLLGLVRRLAHRDNPRGVA